MRYERHANFWERFIAVLFLPGAYVAVFFATESHDREVRNALKELLLIAKKGEINIELPKA